MTGDIQMVYIESSILKEIEQDKPSYSPELLSRKEKDRAIQRAMHGLYRWYIDRSQTSRNWNPDRSFDWRAFHQNHSSELITIIEGFYAVEQFAPDYTSELIRATRENYGRSHFHMRWGTEEARHADLWRNMLLFSRQRTPEQIEQYTEDLRANAWTLPFDGILHALLYTVFQERATQLNYMNLAKVGRGQSEAPQFTNDADPVLVEACQAIATDEAAHYNFFLAGAQVYLYYYPEETLCALVDVLKYFIMPAAKHIPNYAAFVKALYEGGIFGRQQYVLEVIPVALEKLGIASIYAVEQGIKRTRRVPDENGQMRDTAIFDKTLNAEEDWGVKFSLVEESVKRLFGRIGNYEEEVGLSEVSHSSFVRNRWNNEDAK
jgi:acyl-[acyl-carrier-protein] desaturase